MSAHVLKLVLSTFVMAMLMGNGVSAQSYLSDEVDNSLSRKGQIVKRYVKSPNGSQEDEQLFRDYFTKYYFPTMTQSTAEALGDVGKMRADLFKQYITGAQGSAKTFLIDTSYGWAKKVVTKGRYHPSVTFNALLMLGRIDSPTDGTPKVECNTFLCKIIASAVKNERIPQFMLLGALTGLERHALLLDKLPQENQVLTTKSLAGVLMIKQLAGRYDPEIRDWIYLKAANGLASTESAGENGRHFYAIARRVLDKSVSLETRIQLASLLKDLKAPANLPKVDRIATAINKLAVEWSTSEDEMATVFEDLQLRGGRGGALSRGRQNFEHRIQEDEDRSFKYVRAGLIANMKNLEDALLAVKTLIKGPILGQITQVEIAIKEASRVAMNKDEIDLNVADAVKRMHQQIEEVVGPMEKPADPAAVAAAQ